VGILCLTYWLFQSALTDKKERWHDFILTYRKKAMDTSEKTHMKTLSSCMNQLKEEGFKEEYVVKANLLRSLDSGEGYASDHVKILNFYRFEGESDPSDNAILYALETKDGKKGVLIDAYGAYADPDIGKFIVEVEEINKKTDREEK
jgi:hypothetical protein